MTAEPGAGRSRRAFTAAAAALAAAWMTDGPRARTPVPDQASRPVDADVGARRPDDDAFALTPIRLDERTWYVQGLPELGDRANRNFIANAGFVVGDDGVTVIDALGSPSLARALLAAIARLTPRPVRRVIVTHYHADHVYGLQVFADAGAEILAHRGGREYLNSDGARTRMTIARRDIAPWIDATTRLVPAHRWLDDGGLDLDAGGVRLELRHPGDAHTVEDLIVRLPASGIVFAGDLVFRGRIPFVGEADTRGWLAALEAIAAMRPRILVPGHGPAARLPEDGLGFTRAYLQDLRATLGPPARAFVPFDDAYAAADWSRWRGVPMFDAAHRQNAYGAYLRLEQE